MKINLPKTYSQVGNNTPIGNSTINAIGCLTVDASMAATLFNHPIDPSTLAKSVKYSGNLWIWSELTRLFPDIIYKGQIQTPNDLTDAQMNQIKDCIDHGFPVFIQIKIPPTIPEHWLLAVDYNGDDLICADPLKTNGTPHPLTDYGIAPRKVIYAYAWYSGPVAQQPTGDYYKGYDLTNKESMKVAVDQMLKIINGDYVEKTALEQYKATHLVSTSEQAEKDKQTKATIDKMTLDSFESIKTIKNLTDTNEELVKKIATIRDTTIEEVKLKVINNLFK